MEEGVCARGLDARSAVMWKMDRDLSPRPFASNFVKVPRKSQFPKMKITLLILHCDQYIDVVCPISDVNIIFIRFINKY